MRKTVLFFALFILHFSLFAQRNYTKLVNPFIGTGGHGHTYPGASMPFGMMQLSPDTRMADWDGSSGYHYSDSVIYGFSHTHLSGTGIPDYCDLLFLPTNDNSQWNKEAYRSGFSHATEKASPGYYEVYLNKYDIRAQLAASSRSGMHLYQFKTGAQSGSLLIDLTHRDELLEGWIEQVSPTEIRGMRRSKSWAQNQHFYFHIRFEKEIASVTTPKQKLVRGERYSDKNLKVSISVPLDGAGIMRVKTGISGVSTEGARLNLDTEINHWNLEKVRTEATNAWNKELGKIDVKGGTEDQQIVFYTALYHTFLSPNIFQDVDGQYRGTDLKIHKTANTANYSVFSLWDTYRAYHPLMNIINQKRTFDWIATFLYQYKYGGMLPVWELAGNETFCMIGYHSVPVIWDAYQKGIRGFDTKLMLEAMRSYAESNRFGLEHYRTYGYIPNDKEHESVSKTLEYAYDDWCIAQFAKAIGADSVYNMYIQRAQYYKNIFDPQTKKMRGKVGASWHRPFDAREINNFFTEGNSWQYSFAVPQDINGMIEFYGGANEFSDRLNELFTTSSQTTGREQADVTGLIGQYAQGNEPSHHMAYLFNSVGRPDRTQELVNYICKEFYKNSPDGLIGNEDCGQMSAWYIFSAMGFYPVTPGTNQYAIGTPVFDEIVINLENGKKFIIKARRKTPKSFYVINTLFNGKSFSKNYFSHSAMANGGELVFNLGDKKHYEWGRGQRDIFRTGIVDNNIVAVPYVDVDVTKFKNEKTVALKAIEKNVSVYYSLQTPNGELIAKPKLYTAPFTINSTSSVYAYAKNREGKSSKVVRQDFFKIPNDYSIRVLSKVHPLYTAGGNEALIDGILGTTNWRAGEWQSYFDTDFEAIIDLQKIKPVSYVGVHVLQDVSPWIMYPKEIIIYASNDGKAFKEVNLVTNAVGQELAGPQVQQLGAAVNFSTRYIKIKAVNGGKLPSWHESAGNPSHLFIDEVLIR